MPGCSASFCRNRSDQGFRMHVFPRDPTRRAEWIAQVKRDNWEPSNCCYLCEAHFEESQFELRRSDGWVKLKPYAVPTIFQHTETKPRKQPRFLNSTRMSEDRKRIASTLNDTVVDQKRQTPLQNNICNAMDCTSFNRSPPVLLFPFPDNEERCSEWVRRSGNDTLMGKSANQLHQSAHLCAEHFNEKQFIDSSRETLVKGALPTVFPIALVSVPKAQETSRSAATVPAGQARVSEGVKDEPTDPHSVSTDTTQLAGLSYQQLCASASQVKLPSQLWAVHKGLSNESVAFVHTDLSGSFIHVDKAVVFQNTCQANIYFQGRMVLLGTGQVKTFTEIEMLLNKLDDLKVESFVSAQSEEET